MITDDTMLTRRDSALSTEAGDAVLMMDVDSGAYYELEGVAALIWRALDAPMTFGALCAELQHKFSVDAEQCRADTARFVGKLQRLALVELG